MGLLDRNFLFECKVLTSEKYYIDNGRTVIGQAIAPVSNVIMKIISLSCSLYYCLKLL